MRQLVGAAALATGIVLSAPVSAQSYPPTTSPPAAIPGSSAMEPSDNGIAERAARLRGEVRAASARGALPGDEAKEILRVLDRIDEQLTGHVPRGTELRRLKQRLDALQARLDKAASQKG